MADMKDASKIQVGATSSVKADAINAAKTTKQLDAKLAAEAKAVKVEAGQVKYQTCGMSDFRIKNIKFNGPMYTTGDKAEQEILDNCVARNLLNVVEDKR